MVTKEVVMSEDQAVKFLNNLFHTLEKWIAQPQDPTNLSEFEEFFTDDFQLLSNGVLRSRNLLDHLNRIAKLRKKYARIKINGSFEKPLVCHNRIACYYVMHLTSHDKQEQEVYVMATGVLENNKFKKWMQVTHEKDKDWLHDKE